MDNKAGREVLIDLKKRIKKDIKSIEDNAERNPITHDVLVFGLKRALYIIDDMYKER